MEISIKCLKISFAITLIQLCAIYLPYLLANNEKRKTITYIFEIDSALRTKRFYIPEKSLPGLSELYNKYTPFNNRLNI